MKHSNRSGIAFPKLHYRHRLWITSMAALLVLLLVFMISMRISESGLATNLGQRNLSPSMQHPFGTDWLGRDMFTRTMKGLTLSLQVGLTAGAASVMIASMMGLAAACMGSMVNRFVSWLTDLFLSVPPPGYASLNSVCTWRRGQRNYHWCRVNTLAKLIEGDTSGGHAASNSSVCRHVP
jgi:peptide/nickel transport system permease protein